MLNDERPKKTIELDSDQLDLLSWLINNELEVINHQLKHEVDTMMETEIEDQAASKEYLIELSKLINT